MNIDDLTLGQLKQIQALAAPNQQGGETAFEVGRQYFIRTVTYHHTGRLAAIYPNELVLEDAAWIADSGRFADALASGNFNEVEPFPNPVIIARSSIVDATEFEGALPRTQK